MAARSSSEESLSPPRTPLLPRCRCSAASCSSATFSNATTFPFHRRSCCSSLLRGLSPDNTRWLSSFHQVGFEETPVSSNCFMNTQFLQRRRALQARIAEQHLSGVLSMNPASWYYLTGFTGEAGALVVSSKRVWLVTGGRLIFPGKEENVGLRGG